MSMIVRCFELCLMIIIVISPAAKSVDWECSDEVWQANQTVEFCKIEEDSCRNAKTICTNYNASAATECSVLPESGFFKFNQCCRKRKEPDNEYICTREMAWKHYLDHDYMAFFFPFDESKNVTELEKSTCAKINATLDLTYSTYQVLWPFLEKEFQATNHKPYLVGGTGMSTYHCKMGKWDNEDLRTCPDRKLVGHMCKQLRLKWKPFLDHDYTVFFHQFNQLNTVTELEKDTCATINATVQLNAHSVLQEFLNKEFNATNNERYLVSGNKCTKKEWNKATSENCITGQLVGLLCKRFRPERWTHCKTRAFFRLDPYINLIIKKKIDYDQAVNEACLFMKSTPPCLGSCSEVEQFSLFINGNHTHYWISYSDKCKVFEVPLRGNEDDQFAFIRKTDLKWRRNADMNTTGFICVRNASEPQAKPCNSNGPYSAPTYCLNPENLTQISEVAWNTNSGNLFSGVVGVENWMTEVALSFLSKEVNGSIPTTALNINESDLQNKIVRGVDNNGAKLQRLLVNKSESGRLAMVLGRSKEVPPNVKSFIRRASSTVEKQTTLTNRHFLQKITTLTPERGFVIIGAFDGNEGAMLAAQPEFSVTNEIDFEREVVAKWKSDLDDLQQVIFTEVKPKCTYIDPNSTTIEETQLTAGCTTHQNGTVTTCSCNHTTIFSILLSVKAVSVPKEVKYVTYATEGASIFFLLVTVTTLVRVRKSVGSDRTFVQINLCLALILLHGASLFHDFSRQNALFCEIQAVALHYFLLVSGFSMLLEGITLAMKTSRKSLQYAAEDKSVINRFRLVVAWLVPALITAAGAVTGFFTDTYMTPGPVYLSGLVPQSNTSPYKYNRCWLDPQHLVFWCSVFAPLALVLTINLVVMVRVMVLMVQIQQRDKKHRVEPIAQPGAEPSPPNLDTSQLQSAMRMVAMLCPVMGFPWVMGFCIGLDASSDLILIFGNALVNGLQGFLVFLVYCVFGKEVRKAVVSGLRNSAISQHFGWSWQSNNHDN